MTGDRIHGSPVGSATYRAVTPGGLSIHDNSLRSTLRTLLPVNIVTGVFEFTAYTDTEIQFLCYPTYFYSYILPSVRHSRKPFEIHLRPGSFS